jgi:3'-phosphoadenosine 5'-phosphosulfate sulfotransferase (PAPS reductase)/FAD synthetase
VHHLLFYICKKLVFILLQDNIHRMALRIDCHPYHAAFCLRKVWQFLIDHNLPYCKLYDEGYTSLGNVENTVRNPFLKRASPPSPSPSPLPLSIPRLAAGTPEYWPAYALTDWTLERAGRMDKKKTLGAGAGRSALGAASVKLESLQCEFKSIDQRVSKLSAARTAGLVVIGDEILTGQTADSNTAYAMRRLRSVGVSLKRVAILSDDQEEIRDEVNNQEEFTNCTQSNRRLFTDACFRFFAKWDSCSLLFKIGTKTIAAI